MQRLVIYGDFNCPFSYLASRRADRLLAQGAFEVEWRAVQHDRAIAVPTPPLDDEVAAMFDRELEQVRGLLADGETLEATRPPGRPNTRAATERFAGEPEGARPQTRRALFRAYWRDGRDLADPAVLAELGPGPGRVDTALAGRWQEAFDALERPVTPTVVLPDGHPSRGLGGLARLAGYLPEGGSPP